LGGIFGMGSKKRVIQLVIVAMLVSMFLISCNNTFTSFNGFSFEAIDESEYEILGADYDDPEISNNVVVCIEREAIEEDEILYYFGDDLHITLERMDEILNFFSNQLSYELDRLSYYTHITSDGEANLTYRLTGRQRGIAGCLENNYFYVIGQGESWPSQERMVMIRWFYIDENLTQIFWWDIGNDEILTLEEWRESEFHPSRRWEQVITDVEQEGVHDVHKVELPVGLVAAYSAQISAFSILDFDTYFEHFLMDDDAYYNYAVNTYFFLYDFDNDGIPELVIQAIENHGTWGRGAQFRELYIYMYQHGEMVLVAETGSWDEFKRDPFSDSTHLATSRVHNIDVTAIYTIGLEDGQLIESQLLLSERSIYDSSLFEYRFKGEITSENEFDYISSLLLDENNVIHMYEMTFDNLLEALSRWESAFQISP